MKVKSFFLIAFVFLASMLGYFLLNPSYEKSLEAKYYYEIKEYSQAYLLAKEAYKQDNYNKMASTIMTQSTYSLRYITYIQEAKKYIELIESMTEDGDIDKQERAKIRVIAKIMLDSYKKLAPSVVVDENLINQAKQYYDKFSKLYQKAHRR